MIIRNFSVQPKSVIRLTCHNSIDFEWCGFLALESAAGYVDSDRQTKRQNICCYDIRDHKTPFFGLITDLGSGVHAFTLLECEHREHLNTVNAVNAVNAVNTLIRIRLYGSKKSYQFVALFGFFILFLLVFRKSKNTK